MTGPTGNVGQELVNLLDKLRDQPWRVGSRHPEKLASSTAQALPLDFFDSATWARALDGVDELFLLFPLPGNRAARQAIVPFIHAAERAGCRHVVYVSVFGADRMRFIPHHTVEAALGASAMSVTVLRCSFFMQNLHRAISTHGVDIVEAGELFIPAGRGKTTFLDARDARRWPPRCSHTRRPIVTWCTT
ncbi:NAD(P)H-binding protein [Mycobacterium gordonae]|uniref:SDR family oxidoreductase n=1 Tax=Mycobacterium gordonae TaxID=1778 RepID=UPI00210C1A7D|nr:NAD(P)H-binding protein [Mycobacterium gordonae]MCQ4359940.1 NAD(P)H-binding protein [Mycobacterium gordonae]